MIDRESMIGMIAQDSIDIITRLIEYGEEEDLFELMIEICGLESKTTLTLEHDCQRRGLMPRRKNSIDYALDSSLSLDSIRPI